MMIRLLGTSHISKDSVNEIKMAIEEFQPDIIAVELDKPRAAALMSNIKGKVSLADIQKIGVKGFVFAKIGQIVQQRLGKMVGITPGSEMKAALTMAKKGNIKVALIDQPIAKTLKNFSHEITWREKGRFIADIFKGIFGKMEVEYFDLKKVPPSELIERMMGLMKERYPNVYKTLVDDRNKYMVRQIVQLLRQNKEKKILVIVGAGHKKGMEKLLLNVDVV